MTTLEIQKVAIHAQLSKSKQTKRKRKQKKGKSRKNGGYILTFFCPIDKGYASGGGGVQLWGRWRRGSSAISPIGVTCAVAWKTYRGGYIKRT